MIDNVKKNKNTNKNKNKTKKPFKIHGTSCKEIS